MKFIFKFLVIVIAACSFSAYSIGGLIIKDGEKYKQCIADCYKKHAACLAPCEQQRNLHNKAGEPFNYNKCKSNLENKKCLPLLNNCANTKCHPFFKA